MTSGTSVGLSSINVTYYPVFEGGTLALNSGDNSSLAFSVLSAGGVIQSPTSGSATLAGALTGSGGLTFTGTGTTVLTGTNTYSGGTTVSSGTLQGNTTSLQGSIINNGKVVFDQPSTGTFSGTIAGSGSVVVQNSGAVVLTGANTYTGGTTVSSGTLQGNTTSLQGSITNNGKVVFDQPSTGTFSGTIAGSGAVVVQNSGTVVLTGANTYSGGTTVSEGTLSVAGIGPTGTGDVVISPPATLMGTGTILGNGIVSGVIKPGNSPGYLSFAQNLTLNAESTYQQDIAGNVQASGASPVGASGYYAFVSVSGQLVIHSGATLSPRLSNLFSTSEAGYGSNIYVPALGDMLRIVTATGGIAGRFTNLTQPGELSRGTQLVAFYNVNNSNSVDLATVPISYSTTLASNTTNTKSVAVLLDQLLGLSKAGMANATQDKLMYDVASNTAASLPNFAQGLAGEIHAASAATLAQAAQRVQQSVLERLSDYPMSPSQINPALSNVVLTGGISATNPSGLPAVSMSSNPAVDPNVVNVTSAAVADGRAWGAITYQRGDRISNSGANGYNNHLYQVVLGADTYANAALGVKLGGGLALSNTTVSARNGNSTIQQGSLFVYGKIPVLQDYELDGMGSMGLTSTNLWRNGIFQASCRLNAT
jgi:autotransporter-associated beta strand protein